MLPTYHILTLDGNDVIKLSNLNRLHLHREPFKFIIKRELHESTRTTVTNWIIDLYRHSPVNINGEVESIQLDHFTIDAFEPDDFDADGSFRGVLVKEKLSGRSEIVKTYTVGWSVETFMVETLTKLIDDLQQVDSLIAYHLLQENQKLKSEIERLTTLNNATANAN